MSDEKKKAFFDKANLAVTVICALCIPAMTAVISLEISNLKQGFQLMIDTEDKTAAATYIDKPTFAATAAEINGHIGRQEQHIDAVDQRENADNAKHDLEIQRLQDRQLSSITASNNYNPKE